MVPKPHFTLQSANATFAETDCITQKRFQCYRPMVITSIGGDGALQNTASHQIDHLTDL